MTARTVCQGLDPRAGGVVVAGEFEGALAASAEHHSSRDAGGPANRWRGEDRVHMVGIPENWVGGVERGQARLPFRHEPPAYDFYGVA